MQYVVAILRKPEDKYDRFSFHVYSKKTSNLEVMKAYKEEIAEKHPKDKVMLLTVEKARELKQKYLDWFKQYEIEVIYKLNRNVPHKIALESYREIMENR